MKPVIWFVLTGLVSVVLGEVLGVGIMVALPPTVDAVGNFIPFVVAPAVIILAVLGGLLLTSNLRRVSLASALIYPLTFAGGQFALLNLAGNPLKFCLIIFAMTSVVTVLVVLCEDGVDRLRLEREG